MLAVAAIAGLGVGAGEILPGSHSPATSAQRAPREFNTLDAYLSFGWLPKGDSLVAGDVLPQTVALLADHKPRGHYRWDLEVMAVGQCHVRAQTLTCPAPALSPFLEGVKLTSRAPDVRGHRAYWVSQFLVWQWARNGWAGLMLPSAKPSQAIRRDAVKIANNVVYGAPTPPLLFPVQLSHLPSKWRVGSVYYQIEAGRFRVTRFSVTTHPTQNADGGMEFQNKLPSYQITSADPRSMRQVCGQAANRTINGYPVLVQNTVNPPSQGVCTNNADGLFLGLGVLGSHPHLSAADLFASHLRLLGNNPKNWTTKPIQ